MKHIVILLLCLLPLTIQGGVELKKYQYKGKDTLLLKEKINLAKNTIVFVKGKVKRSDTIVSFNVDHKKTIPFKIKGKATKSFVESKIDKTFSIEFCDSIEEINAIKPKDSVYCIALYLLPDSAYILSNKCKESIYIYTGGQFVKTLPSDADVILRQFGDVIITGTTCLPTKFYVKQKMDTKKSAQTGFSLLTVLTILLIAIILSISTCLVLIYIIKKKKNNKEESQISNDLENAFTLSKGSPDSDLYLFDRLKQKVGRKEFYILQKITFPLKEEQVNAYIDQVANTYDKDMQHDVQQLLEEKYSETDRVPFSIQLPVLFSQKKPCERQGWIKIKRIKKYVKYINLPQEDKNKKDDQQIEALENLSEHINSLKAKIFPIENEEISENQLDRQSLKEKFSLEKIFEQIANDINLAREEYSKRIDNADEGAELSKLETEINSLKEELKQKELGFKDELKRKDNDWEKKTADIKTELKNLSKERNDFKNKIDELNKKKQDDSKTISKLKSEITQLEDTLKTESARLKAESAEYTKRLTFYLTSQVVATKAQEFIDKVNCVKELANHMFESYKIKGKDMDAFCYYMMRINQKYATTISGIKDFNNLCIELEILATTGVARKGGWIDNALCLENNSNKWSDMLRAKLYVDFFSKFCGAAIIMADEYANMLGALVKDTDVGLQSKIKECSELMQKIVLDLGYTLNYTRPMISMMNTKDVEAIEFVDAGLEEGTIVEVKSMGVNYGAINKKTEVSIQKNK